MTGRTRNPQPRPAPVGFRPQRRPFWLPASNYYALSFAVGLAAFFLLWGVLHDGREETPWITAGIGFCILIIGAVLLREIVLRRARNRYLALERRFERRLEDAHALVGDNRRAEKLTIEGNARILLEIRQKSEAANVLAKFADAHREVFELCGEYLAVNEKELRRIGVGSPRLAALRKGRQWVEKYHRYHLLQWAQIESTQLTHRVSGSVRTNDKIESGQRALNIVESALEFYPNEIALIESQSVLVEMLTSIRVSHFVEKAERAAFKGNYKQAKRLYRDALFYLGRENVQSEERDGAARRISGEVDRLRQIEEGLA